MSTLQNTRAAQPAAKSQRRTEHPAGSLRFDLLIAFFCLWFTVGLFVDGWAHNNGFTDNTFFTPWHALLYSGIALTGVTLVIQQWRYVGQGYAWSKALPVGYLPSLIGVIFFFIGGGLDFLWHEVFGFEANLEALLSPAHLLLATAGTLIVTGPVRAAWKRSGHTVSWTQIFPALLALTVLLSLYTFFTQYANLFTQNRILTMRAQGYFWDVTGVAHYVLTALPVTFIVLLMIRRWALPFGAITFMLTVNAIFQFSLQPEQQSRFVLTLLAAPLAGLIADGLNVWLRPSIRRPWMLRLFAFVLPFALTALVTAILLLTSGIGWRIHMWLGATFTAGAVGLALGFLLAPPAVPEEE
jgi:hypothetical protein